jgi:hypothetical protein
LRLRPKNWVVLGVWVLLVLAGIIALFTARWSLAFVAMATLMLSLLPEIFAEKFKIKLPQSFIGFIVTFIFASIFLGEAADFYERLWWWDIALHGTASIGFGLIGFLFIFMLFAGDRFAAPPIALALIAFCVAVAIGVTWEIFEFAMDQVFGLNLQKSGLLDTMGDLIVDMLGAFLGATAGYLFLKGRRFGGLAAMIRQFVRANMDLYSKSNDKPD